MSKKKQARLRELEQQLAEQQQAQKNLEESNIQMLDMLESISDGFFSLDRYYVVTYFNGAAERLLGRKSWEILGRNLFDAFPETVGSIFQEKYTEVMEKKTPLSFETYFPVQPYENWYHMRVYPRRDGISVFFRITTDQHKEEEARKKLEAQLRKAEKTRAVATLAGDVANDFNNLLSVIQSSVSLLLFDLDQTHPHYQALKNIEKQAQSGAKLGAQLLGYARKGRYSIDALDMNGLLKKSMASFFKEAGNINLYQDLAPDLMPVEGDRFQIAEVLNNLFANSVEAMPYGGSLTVRTGHVTHEDMAGKPWSPQSGRYVSVSVTDTGIGMDKETVRQVFTPFFTMKDRGGGAGLGMAAAYGIIKGHGGYIDVMSEEGWGTVVTVFLPGKKDHTVEACETDHHMPTGDETIMYVDDEVWLLEVGTAILSKLGYRVMPCEGGKKAIEMLEKNGDQVALVILDMMMPGVGGEEVFEKIRAMNLDVKIILATGCSQDGRVQEMLKKGCDGFIQKPFGLQELSEKVRMVLDAEV